MSPLHWIDAILQAKSCDIWLINHVNKFSGKTYHLATKRVTEDRQTDETSYQWSTKNAKATVHTQLPCHTTYSVTTYIEFAILRCNLKIAV